MKGPMIKNITLKLVAGLCAVLFWFLVLGLQTTPQELSEPIEIKPFNLSDQWTVDELPSAYVTIQTDKETTRSARTEDIMEDIEAYIDLKNALPGNYTGQVFVTSKNPKITIVSVRPNTVSVRIEEKVKKDVPIEAYISGKPHDGFSITQATLTASHALIEGPTSLMERIKKIKAVIQLNGTESETKTIQIKTFRDQNDRELGQVRVTPDKIEATIVLESVQQKKILPIHPQFINTLRNGYIQAVTLYPQLVEVDGEEKSLNGLNAIKTEPIDLDKITKSGTYSIQLQSVKDATLNPKKIDLQLEISDMRPTAPEVDKSTPIR